MADPLDDLLAKLVRLREMAESISEQVDNTPPPPIRPDPTPRVLRRVHLVDFHPAPRRQQ